MEFLSQQQIINELQQSFSTYINNFDIDSIGIFEEEGQDNKYYLGYTITKNGKTYHIHLPYIKNQNGSLSPIETEWTIESDDPAKEDLKGFVDLESALHEI